MCGGPETVNRPRGGALVALNRPGGSSSQLAAITGDLTFHTPGKPDSLEATHVRLAFDDDNQEAHLLSDLHVVIHTAGDLTKNASECGLFRQIRLAAAAQNPTRDAFIEWPLQQALSLQVGSDGIIGRRVSVYAEQDLQGDHAILAEGIVGFNSWTSERASL